MSAPTAFVTPHGDRFKLWVSAPSGWFMLLSGSWAFVETARLFATRCGYRLIATDTGMRLVEQQMNERDMPPLTARERVH